MFSDIIKNALNTAKYNGTAARESVKEAMYKGKRIDVSNPLSTRKNIGTPEHPSAPGEFGAEIRGKQKVISTAIENIEYDPNTRVAHIKFVNGKKNYAYPNVTKTAILNFLRSTSKGRYYSKNFGPKYSVKGYRG